MFIALRQLNTKDGTVNPGDAIPSADSWSHGVQRSEVNCGNVFDLSRGVALDDWNSESSHRRERALLERLPEYGKQVIAGADGWFCTSLTPVDPELPPSDGDEQPEPLQRNVVESRIADDPPRRKGRSRG